MTQITIDNLSYSVVEKLQILANNNNRTLAEEIKVILEQMVTVENDDKIAQQKRPSLFGSDKDIISISDDF